MNVLLNGLCFQACLIELCLIEFCFIVLCLERYILEASIEGRIKFLREFRGGALTTTRDTCTHQRYNGSLNGAVLFL